MIEDEDDDEIDSNSDVRRIAGNLDRTCDSPR